MAQTNKVLGAILFCVGLFTICECNFHLFTGKVCYARERSWKDYWEYGIIWCGNFAGTGLVAFLIRQTRLFSGSTASAQALVQVKNSDTLLSLFILGIFCNIFVNCNSKLNSGRNYATCIDFNAYTPSRNSSKSSSGV